MQQYPSELTKSAVEIIKQLAFEAGANTESRIRRSVDSATKAACEAYRIDPDTAAKEDQEEGGRDGVSSTVQLPHFHGAAHVAPSPIRTPGTLVQPSEGSGLRNPANMPRMAHNVGEKSHGMSTSRHPGCRGCLYDSFCAHSLGWNHYARVGQFGLVRFDEDSQRFVRPGNCMRCSYFQCVWVARAVVLIVPLVVAAFLGVSVYSTSEANRFNQTSAWWRDDVFHVVACIPGACVLSTTAVCMGVISIVLAMVAYLSRCQDIYSPDAPQDRRFEMILGCRVECLFCCDTIKPSLPPISALAYFGPLHAHPIMVSYAWGHSGSQQTRKHTRLRSEVVSRVVLEMGSTSGVLSQEAAAGFRSPKNRGDHSKANKAPASQAREEEPEPKSISDGTMDAAQAERIREVYAELWSRGPGSRRGMLLARELAAVLSPFVWQDTRQLPISVQLDQAMLDATQRSYVMAVVLTPGYLQSRNCLFELASAVMARILPIDARGTMRPLGQILVVMDPAHWEGCRPGVRVIVRRLLKQLDRIIRMARQQGAIRPGGDAISIVPSPQQLLHHLHATVLLPQAASDTGRLIRWWRRLASDTTAPMVVDSDWRHVVECIPAADRYRSAVLASGWFDREEAVQQLEAGATGHWRNDPLSDDPMKASPCNTIIAMLGPLVPQQGGIFFETMEFCFPSSGYISTQEATSCCSARRVFCSGESRDAVTPVRTGHLRIEGDLSGIRSRRHAAAAIGLQVMANTLLGLSTIPAGWTQYTVQSFPFWWFLSLISVVVLRGFATRTMLYEHRTALDPVIRPLVVASEVTSNRNHGGRVGRSVSRSERVLLARQRGNSLQKLSQLSLRSTSTDSHSSEAGSRRRSRGQSASKRIVGSKSSQGTTLDLHRESLDAVHREAAGVRDHHDVVSRSPLAKVSSLTGKQASSPFRISESPESISDVASSAESSASPMAGSGEPWLGDSTDPGLLDSVDPGLQSDIAEQLGALRFSLWWSCNEDEKATVQRSVTNLGLFLRHGIGFEDVLVSPLEDLELACQGLASPLAPVGRGSVGRRASGGSAGSQADAMSQSSFLRSRLVDARCLHVVFIGSGSGLCTYLDRMESAVPVDRLVLCCSGDGVSRSQVASKASEVGGKARTLHDIYHRLLLMYKVDTDRGGLRLDGGSMAAVVLDELSRRVGPALRQRDAGAKAGSAGRSTSLG